MSLLMSQDQANDNDDDDIIYFKSPEMVDKETGAEAMHNPTQPLCNSNHAKSPNSSLLQLFTLRMTSDFDLNLGQIS